MFTTMGHGAGAVRAEDLRRWRARFPLAVAIGEAPAREPAVCVGVVHAIRLVPGRQLEVTVDDGTGRLTAVWTGRSRLPGLQMGAGLRLAGTVAVDTHGRRSMRNPDWTMVTEPYA